MGEILTNNSIVLITEVGISSDFPGVTNSEDMAEPVICYTDRNNCSRQNKERDWYLPDGNQGSTSGVFTVTRGDDCTVRLTRTDNNVISPTGMYCCSVLDGVNVTQRVCVPIGEHAM